jgi:hypothetical protein
MHTQNSKILFLEVLLQTLTYQPTQTDFVPDITLILAKPNANFVTKLYHKSIIIHVA